MKRHGNCKNLDERITVRGDIAEIRTASGAVAIIDAEDVEKVRDYPWCASGKYFHGYKRGTSGPNKVTAILHRLILNAPKGSIVDHIDGDPANNRKSNLRLANPQQNSCNRGPNKGRILPKGVKYIARTNSYAASIIVGREHIHLKYHATIEEAAAAYNKAAKVLHGEFAKLNETPVENVEFKRKRNKYSSYKGLSYVAKSKVWHASISINGETTYLGRYKTEVEAALAYDKAAKEVFGHGAVLNFPEDPSQQVTKNFLPKFYSQKPRNPAPAPNHHEQPKVEQ